MGTENYDPCYPDQPVVHRYLPVWAKLPAFADKPAFIWADDQHGPTTAISYTALTYSQLDAAAERMASGLLGKLRRGDTVLVLASPGLRLVKLLFACQRAGLKAVPVVPPDLSRPGPALAHLMRAVSQTKPHAAVADRLFVDAVARSDGRLAASLSGLRWLPVDELERGDDDQTSTNSNTNTKPTPMAMGCGPGDAYLVQYTSGATGPPKPVVVTAGSAAHNVRAARRAYDLGPSSVVVSWLPQYHDCGLMFLLLTVVSGATCVLASPAAFLLRPRLWLELVTEFSATCTPVPSFALPLVLRRGGWRGRRPVKLGSLRNLILINEPIYKESVDEFLMEFSGAGLLVGSVAPSYGFAENCTFVSTAWKAETTGVLPSYKKLLPSARLPSAMSREAPEIEMVVVDEETGEPARDGKEGELWVSSPSNASGYLAHPSATREAFCARLPGRAGACFVRTGDCGVVMSSAGNGEEDRYLYVVGRSADLVLVDGARASRVHAHYIEAAAFGSAPDRLRGGCIAAFAAPAPASPLHVVVVAELQKGRGASGDHRGLCDGIKRAVWEEESVRVERVVLVQSGAVPRTTSGKVRRGAAREKLVAGKFPVVFEARYDGDGVREGSVRRVGDEDGEMEERCAASWVAGEEGVSAMAAPLGAATRHTRLQSFL